MRIIDKNDDFYDYLQYTYPDGLVTFDRTDSFYLAPKLILNCFDREGWRNTKVGDHGFILLQVCNSFWLFELTVTESDRGTPKKYGVELLTTWKNYSKPRVLIRPEWIRIDYTIFAHLCEERWKYNHEKAVKNAPGLIQAIDTGNYRVVRSLGSYREWYNEPLKTIPLLKGSGLSQHIDPLEMYLSIEEYFSLEKQAQERTESVGITDKEKVVNHGFDVKKSFRGKRK